MMEIQAGKTSKIISVKLLDTSSATADGKTGLLHTNVTAYYFREGQAAVSIALASGSPGDPYSSGKFAEVSGTNARGHYYLHVPNAALAAGAESVTIHLEGTGFFDKKVQISLVSYDPQDSTRLGLDALPDAAADAAGGLVISDAGGLDIDATDNNISVLASNYTAARAGYLDNINGHTPQTGDSFARIGANGSGLTDLATSSQVSNLNNFDPSSDTVFADVTKISGDATAANNLELQYNGTGLTGDTFPSTQAAVADIGNSTAGAVKYTADTDNVSGAIKGVAFVGSVTSGTLGNTDVEDGTAYEITASASDIDVVLGYSLDGGMQAVDVEILANVNNNLDELIIKAYDFVGATWESIGTISGAGGGGAYVRLNLSLLSRHTGSGSELGKVYVRFDNETTTPALIQIDKCIIGAVSTSRSVGYSNGSVWIDTSGGTAGTESYINGVADNPVSSYADALTIASSLDIHRFTFTTGDNITITQSHAIDIFFGYNYKVAMNNQVPPSYIEGAEITGICNGTAAHYVRDSRIGTVSTPLTLNSGCVFVNSGLVNVSLKDSAGAALDVEFLDCHGNTQDSMFPGGSIDFGTTAGTNHEVSFQRWGGPVNIVNLKAGDTVYAHGNGTFMLDASCTGGSFRVAGMINLVDNSGGAVSVLEDGRITKSGIADSVWDEILTGSDHNTATSAGRRLREVAEVGLYEGASVWIDTVNGSAGTGDYENGTVNNQSNNIADATTIANSVGLSRFKIAPASSMTLASSYNGFSFVGDGMWTLDLGGQALSDTMIVRAEVSGTCTSTNEPMFDCCSIKTVTLPTCFVRNSRLESAITLSDAGTYHFEGCMSAVAGTSSPSIDFGAAVGNTNVNFRHYSGGIEVLNMGQSGTDNMSLEGDGALTINANCTGGTIAIRGNFKITDNSGGAVTIVKDDNSSNIADIQSDVSNLNNPSVSEIVSAIMAGGDVDGYTLEESLKICMAALAGELSGAETTTITFRAADDSKDRITATVTDDGNRTSITLDAT